MLYRYSVIVSFSAMLLSLCLTGCGGEKVDVTTPVQVTDEMQRQAEASDKFITEQSKAKKAED